MSLIAHYKMNDNAASTVVVDSTGNYNGTANFNTVNQSDTGKINRALDFNGSSHNVATAVVPQISGSICAWFKADNTGDETAVGSQLLSARCYFAVESTKFAGGIGSQNWSTIRGTTTIVTGTWYHGVLTWTGSVVKLYLNGEQEYSGGRAGAISPKVLYLGANNTSSILYHFNGVLDDVRIYNHALTHQEVLDLNRDGAGTESHPPNEALFGGPMIQPLIRSF